MGHFSLSLAMIIILFTKISKVVFLIYPQSAMFILKQFSFLMNRLGHMPLMDQKMLRIIQQQFLLICIVNPASGLYFCPFSGLHITINYFPLHLTTVLMSIHPFSYISEIHSITKLNITDLIVFLIYGLITSWTFSSHQ